MILVRMQGGLGNQIFQYAAARALADSRGLELALDLRDFRDYERRRRLGRLPLVGRRLSHGDTPRPFLLDRYRIRAREAGALELLAAGFPRHRGLRRRWRAAGLGKGSLVQEQGNRHQPFPASAASPVYLDGYWQSWRYFSGARAEARLRQDLALRREPEGANAAMLRRIRRGPSVCVHVRRGDYVSLPEAAAFHGLMGLDYYRAALRRLGAAARGATLFVFTDDPAWARANLDLGARRVVVDINGIDAPEEDLRLMAACRHFILANSSLSWWGAWLGAHPGKRVVAPKRWFKAGPETPDLCPPAWARI